MAFATLLLAGLYFFPIWSIALEAPQFPEGLGLNIRIDSIEGKEPQDLQNINTLNHYIGMKSINPESIPELTYIPFIVGFLIVSGFLIALFGNKTWVAGWWYSYCWLLQDWLISTYGSMITGTISIPMLLSRSRA